MTPFRLLVIPALTVAAAALIPTPAAAQFVWSNAGGGNWSVGGNWSGGVAPASGVATSLTFGSAATQNASYLATNDIGATPFVLNALIIANNSGATATIAGLDNTNNGLNFGGSAPAITMASGNATIAAAVTIGATTTVSGGTGVLTFGKSVNDGGNGFNLDMASGGNLVLSAGGSFNTLSIQGGAAGATGGTLALNAPTGTGNVNAGLQIGAASGQSGSFTASGGAAVNVKENVYIGDAAGSSGALTVSGAGTVLNAIGGASNRMRIGNFGGGTLNIINGGVVNSGFFTGSVQAGSSSTILVDGPGSNLNVVTQAVFGSLGTSTMTVQNGGTFASSGLVGLGNTSAGQAVGAGTVTVTGSGSSFVSNFETQIAINPGSIGTLNVLNGATCTLTGNSMSGSTFVGVNPASGTIPAANGTINVSGTGSTLTIPGTINSMVLGASGNGNLNVMSHGTVTAPVVFLGEITGSTSTTIVDNASLHVGNQLYAGYNGSGSLTVQNNGTASVAGALYVAAGAGGTGTVTVTGAGSTLTAPQIQVGGGGGITGGTGVLNCNAGGSVTATGAMFLYVGGTANVNGGSLTVGQLDGSSGGTGAVNLGAGSNLTINASGVGLFTGVIAGVGSVIINGPVIQELSGANTYTGATTITAGTLTLGNVAAIPSASAANTVTVNGILDLNGFSPSINSLAGSGTVLNNSASSTASNLSIGKNDTASTFAGVIQDNAGTGGTISLTKIGVGTQILSGANTYTGATTVTAGVLQFNTAGSIGGSGRSVSVNLGAVAAAGYPINQAFLDRMTTGSAGVIALAADSANALDFTSLTAARLGAVGAVTFSGTLTPAGGAYRLGGGGGTLTVATNLTGSRALDLGDAGSAATAINLTGSNSYNGGTQFSGGIIQLTADNLGAPTAGVTFLGGTLRYGAAFTLNSGRPITLGAGGGTIDTNGFNITLANAFSGAGGLTKTGAGSLVLSNSGGTYTNPTVTAGTLSIAGGLASAVTLAGVTDQGAGTVTIGAGALVNVNGLQSAGVLNLLPGPSSSQYSLLTNVGSSPLAFNGFSRTFIGTPETATSGGQPSFVAGIDLHGQNLVVSGGLLVNNGFIADSTSGTVGNLIVTNGALYKGAGFTGVSITTQNGGKVQAGNSPGSASFGRFVVGPGGVNNYVFAIDDATGTAGPSPDAAGHVNGWGLVKTVQQTFGASTSSGDFAWTATPTDKLTFAIDTLLNSTTVGADVAGPMADFDPSRAYSWTAAQWTGIYSGPTDAATLNASTIFDTSDFANPIAGTFGWSLSGSSLSLSYTPSAVPEPGSLALVGLAFVGLAGPFRRTVRVRRRSAGRLAVLVALLGASQSPAQTLSAVGNNTSGNWNSPSIWTTSPTAGQFPNNGQPLTTNIYDVQVTGSGVLPMITLNVPITIDQLNFQAATITATTPSNSLTVNGVTTWSGGTFSGSGTANLNGGVLFPSGAGPILSGWTLFLGNSGPTNSTWSGGNISLQSGILFCTPGSVLTATGDGTISGNTGGATFFNATFIKNGGTGTTTIGPDITNNGVFEAATGTLQTTGKFTNNAATLLAAGGALQINGPLTNLASGTLTGGTYQVQANSSMVFSSAVTTIGPNATVELDGVNSSFSSINSLATVNGTFRLTAGRTFTTAGSLTNTGTLDVQSGSTLTVTGTYTNNGVVTGTGSISVTNLTFTGGTVATGVLAATGTLTVTGATTLASGAVNVGGSTTVSSPLTINAGASLGGAGSTTVPSGSALTVNGSVSQPVTAAGMIKGSGTISNTLNIQSGGHLAPGNSPGTITVGGGLTLNGDYDWDLNGNDNTLAGGTYDKVNGNGTVTLSTAGVVNINFGPGVAFTNTFWNQPHQWNILAAAGGFTGAAIPQLSVTTSSFQTLFPTGVFGLTEQASALVMNWSPNPNSLSWTGNSGGNWNNPAAWFPGIVPTGTVDTQFNFDAASSSTIVNDIPGTFTLNSITFSPSAPTYSLSGNGLNFRTNSSGALPQIVQASANGATISTSLMLTNNLTVSGAGNLALTGAIGGPGSLSYAGNAVLMLTNASNSYSGGTNVVSGIVQVAADSALGTGNVTASGLGNLNFTASSTTSRTFTLNNGMVSVAAGQTLTLSGAQITGGYLNGPGVFATAGASFANVVTRPSATINSNSSSDQFVNDTNGGTFNVVANLLSPLSLMAMTNAGSGSIAIGANSSVNVSDFQSYGLVNVANGAAGVSTTMTNVGTTPISFNSGSRTFIGTIGGNGLAKLELNGQNAIVAGGLFVNDGHVSDNSILGLSTIIADFGALVKGAGVYDNSPITRNGGQFQAGNSPGVATVGRFVFGPGGVNNYVFAIDNATGTAGPTPDALGQVSGWGLVKTGQWQRPGGLTSGDFVWSADPSDKLTVTLDTLINPTIAGTDVPGLMANFDPTRSYAWPAVEWVGGYSGPTTVAALDASTTFDTSEFANPIDGTFGWSLSGSSLSLSYTPSAVPEPGTLCLTGLAAAGFGWLARRRRVKSD